MLFPSLLLYAEGVRCSLDDYFLDGPYRFQMQFGKTAFENFFGLSSNSDQVLHERRQWLLNDEERYLQVLPESAPLLEETVHIAGQLRHLTPSAQPFTDDKAKARYLGENLEPDYLLLVRNSDGVRLVAGCVAFPSSWSLQEKMGLPIDAIHNVVPTLNQSIGTQIRGFLERMKPGTVWTRFNWGLSHSPELNQHPARNLPKLHPEVTLDDVFFRVEEQALLALPKTNGVLFGIRLRIIPLAEFIGNSAGSKLQTALETMPQEIADYKGISPARQRVIEILSSAR